MRYRAPPSMARQANTSPVHSTIPVNMRTLYHISLPVASSIQVEKYIGWNEKVEKTLQTIDTHVSEYENRNGSILRHPE